MRSSLSARLDDRALHLLGVAVVLLPAPIRAEALNNAVAAYCAGNRSGVGDEYEAAMDAGTEVIANHVLYEPAAFNEKTFRSACGFIGKLHPVLATKRGAA